MKGMAKADGDLVQAALAGRREGYEGLVDQHLGSLVGFFRYLSAPADLIDDLVQETFTKAFRSLARFDRTRTFSTWLLSIGRNTYYDHCRQLARERRDQKNMEWEITTPGIEEEIVKRRTLDELLSTLSEEARLLVELRVFQELPFTEIGQILGESEGALRVRFHRILGALRQTAGKEQCNEA